MPWKSPSAPMGSWMTATLAARRSCMDVDGGEEVGADAVHLVDEADAGDAVLVGLAPDGLGLGLDAGDGVEHGDGAVEHPQRALDLDGEVDVAGRVDDVDPVVLPVAGGGRGGDGDPPLLLLDHPVHGGGALVDLADLVVPAGVVEDPLGRRGLARVDVGHDPDVAGPGQRALSDVVSAMVLSRGVARGVVRSVARGHSSGAHPRGRLGVTAGTCSGTSSDPWVR